MILSRFLDIKKFFSRKNLFLSAIIILSAGLNIKLLIRGQKAGQKATPFEAKFATNTFLRVFYI